MQPVPDTDAQSTDSVRYELSMLVTQLTVGRAIAQGRWRREDRVTGAIDLSADTVHLLGGLFSSSLSLYPLPLNKKQSMNEL